MPYGHEIAQSCTIYDIKAFLNVQQKPKMATKTGGNKRPIHMA